MDALICDTSAFRYWRTPPVVRALASAREDDPWLDTVVGADRLQRLRGELAASSELMGAWSGRLLGRATYETAGRSVQAAAPLLSPCLDAPVDLMVGDKAQRRTSRLVRPRVWSQGVPDDLVARIGDGLAVVSPLVALQQLASRASLVRTVLLLSELCGTFSVYVPPEPVRRLLQQLIDDECLPRVYGWSPSLDAKGRLSHLWSRPALLSLEDVRAWVNRTEEPRGRERLRQASELVVARAASPFEVQTGVLLGFSPRRGGEGYAGFSHNHRVTLTPAARRLAGRSTCYCDLFWDAADGRRAVDLECQSALSHLGEESALSDANRSAALQAMGIDVVGITFAQLKDTQRFAAFSELLASKLGVERPLQTPAHVRQALRLREEVLVSWEDLPLV